MGFSLDFPASPNSDRFTGDQLDGIQLKDNFAPDSEATPALDFDDRTPRDTAGADDGEASDTHIFLDNEIQRIAHLSVGGGYSVR